MDLIDIQIKDNWKYALVARLVDRPDFRSDIQQIRNDKKIKLISRDDFMKKYGDINTGVMIYTDKKGKLKKKKDINLFWATQAYSDITISLQNKYKKSDAYQPVIKYSLLFGNVLDEDFYLTDPYVFSSDPQGKQTLIPLLSPKVAIIIEPETDLKSIITAYKDYVDYCEKIGRPFSILNRYVRRIKDMRQWYWRNIAGETAEKIFSTLEDRYGNTRKTVEHGITAYKRILSSPLS